ncbi:scavenger receptor class B member 1-like [Stegodyphus dumicola]|uniref:scavenger receptor class B member 1-like n=1 Tax=Stegodyphus dumicola TaxID=202533 RepID=UPI0015B2D5E8|nr:scavenger receptor class B member 1-like [Stegodyphus dumicola]
MAEKCNSEKVAKFILWTSIIILIISTVFLIVFPSIYKNQLKKQITTEGSVITTIWKAIPLPLYERLYFFNVTNGDDFVRGAPLNVSEVGPYTYKGKWVKKYPQWNSNGTVSYRETRTYHFVPEMSVGSQDDEIYTLNGPMAIAIKMIKNYPWWLKIIASAALKIKDENLITRKKIRELVYDGYNDIIIKIAPTIKPDIPYKNGRFAWLYGKNATDDGIFTVFTGAENASLTNFINTWNGQERLDFWKGDECNMMNGTSIETGPPIDGYQETYTFFQSIFCRSLTFNYTRDVTHYGILSKRFEATYEIFANGSENPNNYCFDVQPGLASGVLDVSPCQFGAPVLISFPHFHMADPSYLKTINGLQPNGEHHKSYVDVDPVTGMSLYLNVRFQINVQLQRVNGIFQLDDIQEGIYPIFWAHLV